MLNILKLKFENNPKEYEFCVSKSNTPFVDQQRNFIERCDFDPESKHSYHLFNPKTGEFVVTVEEIIASKLKQYSLIFSFTFN